MGWGKEELGLKIQSHCPGQEALLIFKVTDSAESPCCWVMGAAILSLGFRPLPPPLGPLPVLRCALT